MQREQDTLSGFLGLIKQRPRHTNRWDKSVLLRIATEGLSGIVIRRMRSICQGKGTGKGEGEKAIVKEIACQRLRFPRACTSVEPEVIWSDGCFD